MKLVAKGHTRALVHHGESKHAECSQLLAAWFRGCITDSGLGQINFVSYRTDSTLALQLQTPAFKFPLEIKI